MPFSNLGLASDKILSLTKISGTGEAGSIDTYRMATRAGENFDFSIQNGRNGTDGVSVETYELHSVSDLQTLQGTIVLLWGDKLNKIVEVSYRSGLNKHAANIEVISGQATTCSVYVFSTSQNEFVKLEDNFIAGTLYVYTYQDTSTTIDTEIDPNSANPVQNSAVAEAISVGVTDDSAALTETQGSYASDAALASAISNKLPFSVSNGKYTMRFHAFRNGSDAMYIGAYFDGTPAQLKIRVSEFDTSSDDVIHTDVYYAASASDIDNLFIEEEEE